MSFYPPDVSLRCRAVARAGSLDGANADGTAASFVCGSFARLLLRINDGGLIEDAQFQTNGCGFMIASADVVCGWLRGKSVTDLHGLNDAELSDVVIGSLGEFPSDRAQCAEIVFYALRKAMATHRELRVNEFTGDAALICTCFGVSEDTIVGVIASKNVHEVEEVSEICRAGSGCGSCRMLIRELIDVETAVSRNKSG